ncbi:mannitol-1-phosphate 5-dehydrogenase [Klugiella xanthotipulae]|uniref:Mannitol-1-phosphate 5-dehydrogenase n=1 Tax=Klugiella xanthotipulae TaxID=244735 RepID=A0A543I567_9MICO|nr:mannitol-1-phosphate 5-dehydrogenase [Klugiella xanthotipulae]TQM65746.1 D-mannitol 1-phosphate 5-dehydrogenase [Klugiella xanthotipulae]
MSTAVHFGAGNIGRGFVGFLLNRAGYEIVFSDVNAELIDALAAADSYTVHEVGQDSADHVVSGFRALNGATQPDTVAREVAGAAIVTTAVGPNVLRFIAPAIIAGLRLRPAEAEPLVVMACENAINATDTLAAHIREQAGEDAVLLESRVLYANTAVDRIVPGQDPTAGLDVTVETFFEWAIEAGPFDGRTLDIPGVTWVNDLAPYIERKLFTVNTGHATTAYYGRAAGYQGIAESLADPTVRDRVYAVLQETKALVVAKHGFDPDVQEAYLTKILTRFANPSLTDTVQRVGRQPLRKVSRHERFIGPATELAERGLPSDALLDAIGALLRFDVAEDPESVELRALLASDLAPEELATRITGLESEHPLFPAVVALLRG